MNERRIPGPGKENEKDDTETIEVNLRITPPLPTPLGKRDGDHDRSPTSSLNDDRSRPDKVIKRGGDDPTSDW
jgi:hypothetical protein